ncbi:hypothetical protein BU16DRAFT_356579 [Lophium mytilinum]|uniref:SSD domain-containing protein n=1 Tax=Lophium mytilinum TaxID=390894 RepID=A0A6A6QUH3_9PEZI|nr:hypothetical protein BU16DRAFT_356579 [Lophium mytilinum]
MIWYLLYPFRGTTEPPRLSQTHPLRLAFQRHGTATARHWRLSILLSVATAVLLCYPVLFFSAGSNVPGPHNIPHHVWTSTTEFRGGPNTKADVEMRQVWMHGDYMKALDPRVLRQALRVQNALIVNGFGPEDRSGLDSLPAPGDPENSHDTPNDMCAPGSRSLSWAFHSPLMLWNCSLAALESDSDVLATINRRMGQQTYLNFTLRPSSIFAGKSFKDGKLQAADALVITVFDMTKTGIQKSWETRLKALAEDLSDQWSLYPETGMVAGSQLYEFRFRPMTMSDDIFLALVYGLMALYVLASLGKMRAVTSRFGLAITVVCKMSAAIVASFTICGMLKINLAHIPREAYPFVVLVIGLDNIFRLINEVLANPPEMPTIHRIGNALGEVGHLSLAQTLQNLLLLWLLSRVVSPGVAAFCAFAAVALVFDFVFHLTFFLAVLSVDVRRLELQDSLDRLNIAHPTTSTRQEQQPWLGTLIARRVPVQTRLAGSVAIVSFVLMLNWHFFDSANQPFSLRRIFDYALATRDSVNASRVSRTVRPQPPINQARTPAEWLKMQDHDTAKEFIRFFKPNAYSFVARVYDPVFFVLKGADGRKARPHPTSVLYIIRQMTTQHLFPVALTISLTIALVTLLMSYLLSNELLDDLDDGEDAHSLAVRTLPASHGLDIIRLTSCGRGHIVSISLDRSTCIWYYDRSRGYSQMIMKTAKATPPIWPIIGTTIDDSGRFLALLSDNGQAALWSLVDRRFFKSTKVPLRGQLPVFFSFASMDTAEHERLSLVFVTPDGCLTDLDLRSSQQQSHQISQSKIISTSLLCCARGRMNIISASRNGQLHVTTKSANNEWRSETLPDFGPRLSDAGKLSKIRSILTVSSLGLVFAVRQCEVDVFDFHSRSIIHTVRTRHVKPNTLKVLHSHRSSCSCGATTINSLSIVYTEIETHLLIMHTFSIDDSSNSQICLRSSSYNETRACQGLDSAREGLHWVHKPGVWEATHAQSVIGVRKRSSTPAPSSIASGADTNYFEPALDAPSNALKHRTYKPATDLSSLPTPVAHAEPSANEHAENDTADEWEAWTLMSAGELLTTPLFSDAGDASQQDDQLWVSNAGPIARLGKRAVAVGFGNAVKIIMLGNERFEEDTEEFVDPTVMQWRSGRRGLGRKAQ